MHTSTKDNNILFRIDFENFIFNNLDIREMVVASLLVDGYSQKDIAKHQNISYTYVKIIVRKIRVKFLEFRKGMLC